jgi:hypothetical protein
MRYWSKICVLLFLVFCKARSCSDNADYATRSRIVGCFARHSTVSRATDSDKVDFTPNPSRRHTRGRRGKELLCVSDLQADFEAQDMTHLKSVQCHQRANDKTFKAKMKAFRMRGAPRKVRKEYGSDGKRQELRGADRQAFLERAARSRRVSAKREGVSKSLRADLQSEGIIPISRAPVHASEKKRSKRHNRGPGRLQNALNAYFLSGELPEPSEDPIEGWDVRGCELRSVRILLEAMMARDGLPRKDISRSVPNVIQLLLKRAGVEQNPGPWQHYYPDPVQTSFFNSLVADFEARRIVPHEWPVELVLFCVDPHQIVHFSAAEEMLRQMMMHDGMGTFAATFFAQRVLMNLFEFKRNYTRAQIEAGLMKAGIEPNPGPSVKACECCGKFVRGRQIANTTARSCAKCDVVLRESNGKSGKKIAWYHPHPGEFEDDDAGFELTEPGPPPPPAVLDRDEGTFGQLGQPTPPLPAPRKWEFSPRRPESACRSDRPLLEPGPNLEPCMPRSPRAAQVFEVPPMPDDAPQRLCMARFCPEVSTEPPRRGLLAVLGRAVDRVSNALSGVFTHRPAIPPLSGRVSDVLKGHSIDTETIAVAVQNTLRDRGISKSLWRIRSEMKFSRAVLCYDRDQRSVSCRNIKEIQAPLELIQVHTHFDVSWWERFCKWYWMVQPALVLPLLTRFAFRYFPRLFAVRPTWLGAAALFASCLGIGALAGASVYESIKALVQPLVPVDHFLTYSPHMLTTALSEYSRGTNADAIVSTLRSKLRSQACLPIPDDLHLEVLSGTEAVCLAVAQQSDFYTGGLSFSARDHAILIPPNGKCMHWEYELLKCPSPHRSQASLRHEWPSSPGQPCAETVVA